MDGDDVTVIALSNMVRAALAVAKDLGKQDISVEVIDPRTTSPLDEETILESLAKTGRLVIVDESPPRCSLAADIAALAATKAFGDLKAPVEMVTAPHTPVPFAPSLERLYVPGPDAIAQAVERTMRS
jgi:pyruvate dehydrogenase E1 component beta subunit